MSNQGFFVLVFQANGGLLNKRASDWNEVKRFRETAIRADAKRVAVMKFRNWGTHEETVTSPHELYRRKKGQPAMTLTKSEIYGAFERLLERATTGLSRLKSGESVAQAFTRHMDACKHQWPKVHAALSAWIDDAGAKSPELTAWQLGYDGFRNEEKNPFTEGTEAAKQWDAGWHEAAFDYPYPD